MKKLLSLLRDLMIPKNTAHSKAQTPSPANKDSSLTATKPAPDKQPESSAAAGSPSVPTTVTPSEAPSRIIASDTWGDLSWTLDDIGKLVISGTGEMNDFSDDDYDTPAWKNCNSSIKQVTVEKGVTSIGRHAFQSCDSLASVTIPDSVTTIWVDAFSDCYSLQAINVLAENAYYTSATGVLFNKAMNTLIVYPKGKKDTSYVVPDSVSSIGHEAFAGCTSLTSVTIPDSVTIIGYEAFSGCTHLTSVTIPGNVTIIGYKAFDSCSLQTVYYGGTQAQWQTIRMDNDSLDSYHNGLTSANIIFQSSGPQ